MSFWGADNLKAVTAGRWLARPQWKGPLAGISTDSRVISCGQAFLALRGDRYDGHAFLEQASRAGAPVLVIDREGAFTAAKGGILATAGVLLVEDTSRALMRLAHAYRRTLSATKVIAVGGSNGKTTTVRMIDAVLSTQMRGRSSQKSFNNAVGVPLTILGAQPGDQYLVCEVGTNAPGEIAPLAAVVEPDICVITSLGREHLEGLSSIEGVAREEAMLVSALREGGCAVVAHDETLVGAVRSQLRSLSGPARVLVTVGRDPGAEVRVVDVSQSFEGVRFTLHDRCAFAVPLLGAHNASNAAMAVAVARRLGLRMDDVGEGLSRVQGPPMRLDCSSVAGVRVINDAYNANPESMLAAIETFRDVVNADPEAKLSRRVLILGDMLELGDQSSALHQEVLTVALRSGCADVLILVGPNMGRAATELRVDHEPGVHLLQDVAPPRDAHAAGLLRAGDVVLLKGSRGTGLERVVGSIGRGGPLEEGKPHPGLGQTSVAGGGRVSMQGR